MIDSNRLQNAENLPPDSYALSLPDNNLDLDCCIRESTPGMFEITVPDYVYDAAAAFVPETADLLHNRIQESSTKPVSIYVLA